jgi:hypothetical protein
MAVVVWNSWRIEVITEGFILYSGIMDLIKPAQILQLRTIFSKLILKLDSTL